MKNIFAFKKLSGKITFMIGATVIIVAGAIAGYMQTRILTEIGRHTRLSLQVQAIETAKACDFSFLEAAYSGTEMSVGQTEELVSNIRAYNTGFALMADNSGSFFETNDFIKGLRLSERNRLADGARANPNDAFEISIEGVRYMVASSRLINNYSVYIIAPIREVNAEITASLTRFVIIFVVCFALVIVISHFLSKPIARPLTALSSFMKRAASTGDLTLNSEDIEAIKRYSQIKDETGQVVGDVAAFIGHVRDIANALEVMVSGDLTHDMKLQSDKDTMGIALHHMFQHLNDVFREISESTYQIAEGSMQTATGAQSLAQGSTEQAAAVDQLSSSIAEISKQTKDNADMAGRATAFAKTIKGNAEKGSQQMDGMMSAVKDINHASQSIEKVIKVINDIAFQTNILALNAAVEAARAGQHGKGFAVVAEEVRNLASKSADAAKDTGVLIANSMEKAELGARIANETAASFDEIVSGINESSQVIAQIATSSEEQSLGIAQINTGIDQVAQVIQQNSATAEESAAASEELNDRFTMLEEMLKQFKLKEGGVRNKTIAAASSDSAC